MPHYIIHKDGVYNFYSTVVDCPIFVSGLTLEQLKRYYKEEYGNQGMRELEPRLKRAQEVGTSSRIDRNLRACVRLNRAGENEANLPFNEFVAKYLTIRDDDDEM